MTSAQPGDNLEQRMDRVEEMMVSAGRFLMNASEVAQRNAADIESLNQGLNHLSSTFGSQMSTLASQMSTLASHMSSLTQRMDTLTQRIDALTSRVDSLAANGERQDRILDYLLRREAGDVDDPE